MLKRGLALLLVLLLCCGMAGAEEALYTVEGNPEMYVAVTDQLGNRVLVYRLEKGKEPEQVFSWKPSKQDGYGNAAWYEFPDDVRLRRHPETGELVFLTCSAEMLAMVKYPSGERVWSTHIERDCNAHAIELLPNGCIAVAGSSGNILRVYSARTPDDDRYTEMKYLDAHGLLWDPERNVLWAVGMDKLTAFTLEGTPEETTLKEDRKYRTSLPNIYGHDIMPVYGDSDKLWVTAIHPYLYDKTTKRILTDYDGSSLLDTGDLKSVGSTAEGVLVRALPNGTFRSWDTDTLDVLWPGDTELTSYQLPYVAFYRARIWSPEYQ